MFPKAETITAKRQARLRSLVDDHHRLVVRTLRKGGVPRDELDDEVQRTFIIVSNRLDDVRLGSERSFLCQVARHRAFHSRRSHARQREFPSETLPEPSEPRGTPEDMAERRQMRALLDAAVESLGEALRSVFLLYELEEMDMEPERRRVHHHGAGLAFVERPMSEQAAVRVEQVERAVAAAAAGGEQEARRPHAGVHSATTRPRLPDTTRPDMSVLNFDPDQDLQPGTTYEVVLPKGGVADLVGNTLAAEWKSTFTTN